MFFFLVFEENVCLTIYFWVVEPVTDLFAVHLSRKQQQE